jgi:Rrf2 family protein
MALLSRKVDYALLILSYLHHQGSESACAREIASRFDLSRPFVANILKLLCREGFVRARRGSHGGYALRRPAGEICLCELLDAVDGPFHLAECNRDVDADKHCSHVGLCPVQGALAEVDRRVRDVLSNVTLADLFRGPAEVGALPGRAVGLPVLACGGNQ